MLKTMTAKNPKIIGSLQVILASICWGTLGIFSTQLNKLGFDSVQIASLRIVTAGVLLTAFLPKLRPHLTALTWRQWLGLTLQSWVGVLGMTLAYFYAVQHVGVSLAVALLYTAPVFSLGLAKLLLGEKIATKAVILAIVAVAGVACLMVGGNIRLNSGVVVGLLSGLCYSLYGILGKKSLSYHYPPLLVFVSSVVLSAVVLLALPQTYHTYAKLWALPWLTWRWVLGLSLMGTMIPFFLYMSALQKLPATQASVFTIIEPLTAIILAVVLLNQPLYGLQMVGIGLIVVATLANAIGNSTTKEID